MASGLLLAELTATCNALGYYDGKTYHLEPHCCETAKDLIRYLRRDSDNHEIRRFLGNTKIIQTDLLRIIQCHSTNKELFDVVLRLLVNLSTPALLVYNEVVPKEKTELNQYLEIVSHLQSYKESFSDHVPWDVLTEKLGSLLNLNDEDRDDDVQRLVERILILVRNVLHVPANHESEARPDNDASVHDQVLWALHQSGMLDMVLYIASSIQESTFYMHVMEIICLMVREQPPALLAKTAAQRSEEEKKKDSCELSTIRSRESVSKQEKMRKYQGTRHFGGTFVIKNLKSTSDKDIIYHKPFTTIDNISLDLEKKRVKIPKNRQPLKCENAERKSALSVRLILKQFCIEILNAAYNPLMRYVKDILNRGKSQDNDESYYFNAMKFFMEFNRNYKFQVKLVSETLSVETFHFIQKYLESWHEMMTTDKAKIPLWSSRMHLALKAYKELLYNLIEMDKSQDGSIRESSRVIKSNIFYVMEYREMLLLLIKTYKKPLYSLQYVRDLMETTHVFLKLIENFAKNKKIIVQKKSRKPKKSKKKDTKNSMVVEQIWSDISSEVADAIASPESVEVIPFDATSDTPLEEQKVDAMKRIQMLLKEGNYKEAVSFLRASREVWPENDCFGAQNLSTTEELACIQEIFMTDLNLGAPESFHSADEEEDEEDCFPPPIEERTFDVDEFLKSFANSTVLKVCGLLLKNFEHNSPLINHCIAKMMHRVAWDCKLPAMLFQASIFRSFQKIFAMNDSKYKELATLGVYIVRKFTETAATNKKILAELLFWKSAKDAFDIEMGYGSYQEKSKASKAMWEEHEEDELKKLFAEYKRDFPEGTTKEMIEWITSNIIKDRTKLSVSKKLRELHLIEAKAKKVPWTPEEEELLRSLFTEFMESPDPVGVIMERMGKSRREINKTLLRLGVVSDRSELKNKSSKRPRNKTGMNQDADHSDSSRSESSSDDEGVGSNEVQRPAENRPSVEHASDLLIKAAATEVFISDGVKWLREVMDDNLEDIDDGSVEVPLLPLSENSVKSVDCESFQQFLLAIGLYSPIEHQERYWRFPADWKEQHYKERIKLLDSLVSVFEAGGDELSEEMKQIIREHFRGPTGINTAVDSDSGASSDHDKSENKFNALTKRANKKALKNKPKSKAKEKGSSKSSFKLDKQLFIDKDSDESDSERNIEKESSELQRRLDLEGSRFFDDDSVSEINNKNSQKGGDDSSSSDDDTVSVKKFSKHNILRSSVTLDTDSDDESGSVKNKENQSRLSHRGNGKSSAPSEEKPDENEFERVLKSDEPKSNGKPSMTSSESESEKDDSKGRSGRNSSSRRSNKVLTDSEEDDNGTNDVEMEDFTKSRRSLISSDSDSDNNSAKVGKTLKNSVKAVPSDSEEDSEPTPFDSKPDSQHETVPNSPGLSISPQKSGALSEDRTASQKRNRGPLDSDEELSDSPKVNKKRHIIDSDDDD